MVRFMMSKGARMRQARAEPCGIPWGLTLLSRLSPQRTVRRISSSAGRGGERLRRETRCALRAETGRLGDWETGRLGDWETGRLGDWETGRLGAVRL
jgi:hypothetical protein